MEQVVAEVNAVVNISPEHPRCGVSEMWVWIPGEVVDSRMSDVVVRYNTPLPDKTIQEIVYILVHQ